MRRSGGTVDWRIQVNAFMRSKSRTLKLSFNSPVENVSQKDRIHKRFLSVYMVFLSSEESSALSLMFSFLAVVALVLFSWMLVVVVVLAVLDDYFYRRMLGFLLRPFPVGIRFARRCVCHTVKGTKGIWSLETQEDWSWATQEPQSVTFWESLRSFKEIKTFDCGPQ